MRDDLLKSIKQTMELYIDKFNDSETQQQVYNDIVKVMERYNVADYTVVCDERCNTPQLIDENKLQACIIQDDIQTVITMEPHPFQMFSAQFTTEETHYAKKS